MLEEDYSGEEIREDQLTKDVRFNFVMGVLTGALATVAIFCLFQLYLSVGGFTGSQNVLTDSVHREKIAYLESLIDRYYLEEKDEEALAEGVYTGLIYGLGDVYSRYYTAEEYEQESSSNEGSYTGIGILIQKPEGDYALVTGVYEDSPAELAGLQAGDLIQAIDGNDVKPLSDREMISMIRQAEESVLMTVYRSETEETLDLSVQVKTVQIHSVKWEMLEDKTGYLKILEFSNNTPEQFRQAMAELRGGGMERLIVDLRDNPGGMVPAVCDILRQILPEGLIVYSEDKNGHREEEYCDGTSRIELPMAVLVNNGTASSSEIFAGAVKDYELGPIVGETTYGKGIIQGVFSLEDGSAVSLTKAKYYTPNGNDIHGKGIQPDLVIPDNRNLKADQGEKETDEQLEAAIRAIQ